MTVNKPVRVLQINSGSKNFGGVSSFLYNVYTHIDRTKIQFDFLSPCITTYELHRQEIEQLGGKIYELGIKGNVLTKKTMLYSRLLQFLSLHQYEIIHINSGNFFFNFAAAKAARKAGIKNIYIHSHSIENTYSSRIKKTLIRLLKPELAKYGTRLLACSKEAAEFMFGKENFQKVTIIRNGVDIKKFKFDEAVREMIRKELKLNNKHVIGNVGRFSLPKNHEYLIDVFRELSVNDNNAFLLLVGDGEEKTNIENKINELNLLDKVIMLRTQKNIEKYYQAMDVFLFPSKWEGLGMVLVEAQISGLPCISSTNVPEEAAICDDVKFLDTNEADIREWVESIITDYSKDRKSRIEEAYNCGYAIETVAYNLMNLYLRDVC